MTFIARYMYETADTTDHPPKLAKDMNDYSKPNAKCSKKEHLRKYAAYAGNSCSKTRRLGEWR